MSNPFKTDEFQQLRREWYEKLRKEGFEEIESVNPKKYEAGLKVWHSFYFQDLYKNQVIKQQSITEYYYQATHFLNSHQFDCECHKEVWHLHSTGMGVRDISRLISKQFRKINKDEVAVLIRKLRSEMNLRKYLDDKIKE